MLWTLLRLQGVAPKARTGAFRRIHVRSNTVGKSQRGRDLRPVRRRRRIVEHRAGETLRRAVEQQGYVSGRVAEHRARAAITLPSRLVSGEGATLGERACRVTKGKRLRWWWWWRIPSLIGVIVGSVGVVVVSVGVLFRVGVVGGRQSSACCSDRRSLSGFASWICVAVASLMRSAAILLRVGCFDAGPGRQRAW